jgi:hypothetical protein
LFLQQLGVTSFSICSKFHFHQSSASVFVLASLQQVFGFFISLARSRLWHQQQVSFFTSASSASAHFRGISSKFGFPAASASAFALESAVSSSAASDQLWLCIRSKSFVSFQYQRPLSLASAAVLFFQQRFSIGFLL